MYATRLDIPLTSRSRNYCMGVDERPPKTSVGLVRIGPVLSDVEETSLTNQPVTQVMQRPIRPAIPCTRKRNLIPILLNLAESTYTEKKSESLFETLFLLCSDLPKSSLPLRCSDQHLLTHFLSLSKYVHGGMTKMSL
jgi:hypothetical protein